MNEITKLIETLKGISKSNLLVIVFSVSVILLVFNFNQYAPHIESMIKTVYETRITTEKADQEEEFVVDVVYDNESLSLPLQSTIPEITPEFVGKRYIVGVDDLEISESDLEIIKEYAEEGFIALHDQLRSTVFINIYKFIPEGDDRYFQGRALVTTYAPTIIDHELILRELGLVWMPMWINKSTIERTMDGENFLTKIIHNTNGSSFLENDINSGGKVNLTLMFDLGIRYAYYHTIMNGKYPVGYLVWGLANEPNEEELKLINIRSTILSSRIRGYMLEDER